uniref:Cullin N-terminal domain-containing protein n=1 Tax=Acrobeloides nanus TaxID=290746 RepID=A0A914D2M4_9BILA
MFVVEQMHLVALNSTTCRDQAGNQLLETYTTLWRQFKFSSEVVDKIFAYLNRHWIRRELDEDNQDIYEVYNLAIVTWRTILFEPLHQNVTAAILQLIEQHRNGEMIQGSLFKDLISSYVELGINKQDEGLSRMRELIADQEFPRSDADH